MAQWLRMGNVLKSKSGEGTYIKINFPKKDGKPVQSSITLHEGQTILVQDPRKNKFITEERAAKIPAYVLFELVLPPDEAAE